VSHSNGYSLNRMIYTLQHNIIANYSIIRHYWSVSCILQLMIQMWSLYYYNNIMLWRDRCTGWSTSGIDIVCIYIMNVYIHHLWNVICLHSVNHIVYHCSRLRTPTFFVSYWWNNLYLFINYTNTHIIINLIMTTTSSWYLLFVCIIIAC